MRKFRTDCLSGRTAGASARAGEPASAGDRRESSGCFSLRGPDRGRGRLRLAGGAEREHGTTRTGFWLTFSNMLPRSTKESSSGETPAAEAKPAAPWDGFVRISLDEAKTIGLVVVSVEPQADPIMLPLMGRTDYDPNTLSKIRPRFDTLVEKVRVERGQKVTIGAPLVDLFSTELAAAKNDFQTAFVQWVHDRNLLKMKDKLLLTRRPRRSSK